MTAPDPWGPYRDSIVSLVASCRDYLGRIERSLAGEIAPDRHYVGDKARQLQHTTLLLVRRSQDIERWLAQCGHDIHHTDDGEVWTAECTRPSEHTRACDDTADQSADRLLTAARDMADDAEEAARWLGDLPAADPAAADPEDVADITELTRTVADRASRLAGRLGPAEDVRHRRDQLTHRPQTQRELGL